MSDYVPIALRKRVHSHFLESCGYCKTQEYLTVVTFEVEHIVPRSLGGATEFDNLCLACPSCNRFKSNRLYGVTEDGLECRLATIVPLDASQQTDGTAARVPAACSLFLAWQLTTDRPAELFAGHRG